LKKKKVKDTVIPLDFFLDKKNLTENELQLRFANGGIELFYKDCPADGESQGISLPPGVTPFEDFSYRYVKCRNIIMSLSIPRLKDTLEENVSKHLPASLQHLKTYHDLLLHYKTHSNGKELRQLYRAVTVMVWSNTTGAQIERDVMYILKIVYKQELVEHKGQLLNPERKCGFIARLVTRVKGTVVIDPFRLVISSRVFLGSNKSMHISHNCCFFLFLPVMPLFGFISRSSIPGE
jgi:hypothetical protein